MNIISAITKEQLISWLSPYARALVPFCDSAYELLQKLSWHEGIIDPSIDPSSYKEIESRIFLLLGMNFSKAKLTYTSGVL